MVRMDAVTFARLHGGDPGLRSMAPSINDRRSDPDEGVKLKGAIPHGYRGKRGSALEKTSPSSTLPTVVKAALMPHIHFPHGSTTPVIAMINE